MFYTADQTVLQ